MTTQTIDTNASAGSTAFADAAVRALAAISAGWGAARDWRRLSARGNDTSRDQIAREIFERNFA